MDNRIELTEFAGLIEKIKSEAGKALIGQEKMFELLLTGFFAGGHVLIEGVPGVAKTLTVKILAQMSGVNFKRIQFTPDLMPSDILGTSIFNPKSSEFNYKKGPIFSNLVLIDEINRAPSKTQAALFEVMEEFQVTQDGDLYEMDDPFMVLATQNPIEQEGTYRLPEAQLDRFIFKITVGYPELNEEVQILSVHHEQSNFKSLSFIDKVISKDDLVAYRKLLRSVLIKEEILKYIAELVQASRNHPSLFLGASPRASLDLMKAGKTLAAMRGRDFVTPEDIQFLLIPVLDHRIQLTPEAELQGFTLTEICQEIIQQVQVPR